MMMMMAYSNDPSDFVIIIARCGLFFLAYSNDPSDFEYLLERMGGYGRDGHTDLIFRLSRCASGNYWYFPGVEELERLMA